MCPLYVFSSKTTYQGECSPYKQHPWAFFYSKAEIFTQGKEGSDGVTEYTCWENMQAETEEKITFCHKQLPCSSTFFSLQIRTSHFLCSFRHLLWFPDSWLERIEIWLEKQAMGHVIFKRGEAKIPIMVKIHRLEFCWVIFLQNISVGCFNK